MMKVRIQIIIALVTILALIIIVNMIRKRRLELKYALVWLAAGAGILVLDCFPSVISWLAEVLGIYDPTNMLFFLGFCFSLVLMFILTVVVSRMSIRIKNLTQEVALYEKTQSDKK